MQDLKRKYKLTFGLTVIGYCLVLLVWYVLKQFFNVPDRMLPSIPDVVNSLDDFKPSLIIHISYTVIRLLIGFMLGVTIGVLTGTLIYKSAILNKLLFPTIQALRSVPPIATVPFFILWFGFSELGRYTMVLLGIAFNIAISSYQILSFIPEKYLVMFKSYNKRPQSMIKDFLLPRIFEELLPTIRFSLSTALGLVIVSELLGAQVGLGYLIQTSRSTYSMHVIFLAMIFLGLINSFFDKFVSSLWGFLTFWKQRKSLNIFILIVGCLTLISCGESSSTTKRNLKLGISPYQDIAMITNIENLKLEDKFNLEIDLVTLPWEEILPAIGSQGETIDVGFASYIEYITKSNNINQKTKDPILFIYPAYVFAGGGFTTLDKTYPVFDKSSINDKKMVRQFLTHTIGAQKNSMFDMALYSLANNISYDINSVKIIDTPMADGILALQSGSIDFASAGLTQRNEIERLGGKVVLSFETLGFADITGFICKESVLKARRKDIEKLIKMWFTSVAYITTDVNARVGISTLPYLNANASTKYTIETYKKAISQEIFPKTILEAEKLIISNNAQFSAKDIYNDVSDYLIKNKVVSEKPVEPKFIQIK